MRRLVHLRPFVMVARQPAHRHAQRLAELTKRPVRLHGTVLGNIPGHQQQVDMRLLGLYQLEHIFQPLTGIHAHQRAVRLGEQVTVGQLDQQD